jgi:hypothetical protein
VRGLLLFAIAALAVSTGVSEAAKLPRYGIFVYSSVCTEGQGGGATGNHVVLIREGNGDVLYWYWPEGPMEKPAQAHPLAIDDKTGAIRFSVDQASEGDEKGAVQRSNNPAMALTYQGTISEDAITLNPGDGKSEVIPRVTDFSKKTAPCKAPSPDGKSPGGKSSQSVP